MAGRVLNVRLTEEQAATLDSLVKAHGVSRSEIIRGMLSGLDPAPEGGVWVVRYYTEGIVAIFPTELEALRFYALDGRGQVVEFVSWGEV